MPKPSLQRIADFYLERGYRGKRLRQALVKDKVYSRLFNERKKKLTRKIRISTAERKKYVLSLNQDFDILKNVKLLEKAKLNQADKELIKLIKTQLEDDWRGFLIKALNKLLKKY
ncbi:MAG: hypothetical protein ACD_12C00223G0002 [uncultured bacterium]|nr:MAG: hypothetical protein ACD_12C00223G0002 [uncultured bacterium]